MGFITALKTPLMLAVTTFSWVMFILAIVEVTKQKDVYGSSVKNYSGAVVALLCCGMVQVVWSVFYWVFQKRRLYSIFNTLMAMIFFLCWNFGAVVALTVKRHDICVGTPKNPGSGLDSQSDCQGVIRGMMGMSWVLFGFGLIYACYLPILAAVTRSPMSTPVGLAGMQVKNEDEEKAPAH